MITLSAPRKSGYTAEFDNLAEARQQAAYLLDIPVEDMVEVEINDTTYCYASHIDADADRDGAYAVKYTEA